jgi:hypothetical protein
MLKTATLGMLLRLAAALGTALLVYGLLSWSFAQGATATAEAPARVSVRIPQVSAGRSVLLELTIKAVRNPGTATLGGVVRLRRSGGAEAEVGRFSLFAPGADQRFQFNVTEAVRQLDLSGATAEVEVTLIDRADGRVPAGAQLGVGPVQVDVR